MFHCCTLISLNYVNTTPSLLNTLGLSHVVLWRFSCLAYGQIWYFIHYSLDSISLPLLLFALWRYSPGYTLIKNEAHSSVISAHIGWEILSFVDYTQNQFIQYGGCHKVKPKWKYSSGKGYICSFWFMRWFQRPSCKCSWMGPQWHLPCSTAALCMCKEQRGTDELLTSLHTCNTFGEWG